jgi:hypothetical protein
MLQQPATIRYTAVLSSTTGITRVQGNYGCAQAAQNQYCTVAKASPAMCKLQPLLECTSYDRSCSRNRANNKELQEPGTL